MGAVGHFYVCYEVTYIFLHYVYYAVWEFSLLLVYRVLSGINTTQSFERDNPCQQAHTLVSCLKPVEGLHCAWSGLE